jgi:hypothetical protein
VEVTKVGRSIAGLISSTELQRIAAVQGASRYIFEHATFPNFGLFPGAISAF